MFVPTGERVVDLSQSIVDLVGTFTSSAIALLKGKIGYVPLVGISTTGPGPGIDLLPCVSLHPLYSRVLAGLIAPVSAMDECLLGWKRHLEQLQSGALNQSMQDPGSILQPLI